MTVVHLRKRLTFFLAPLCVRKLRRRRSGDAVHRSGRYVLGADLNCSESGPSHATRLGYNPNLSILKYGRKRSAAAVRECIRPALTIVRDESPDGHRLHRVVDDANRAVVNASRDAEQNHAVLCAEFCRRLFHDLLPPPVLGKGEGQSRSDYGVNAHTASQCGFRSRPRGP